MTDIATTNGTHAGPTHPNDPPHGKAKISEADALAGLKAAQDEARAANAAVDQAIAAQDKAKKAHHDAEAATLAAVDKAEQAEARAAGWRAALRRAS